MDSVQQRPWTGDGDILRFFFSLQPAARIGADEGRKRGKDHPVSLGEEGNGLVTRGRQDRQTEHEEFVRRVQYRASSEAQSTTGSCSYAYGGPWSLEQGPLDPRMGSGNITVDGTACGSITEAQKSRRKARRQTALDRMIWPMPH